MRKRRESRLAIDGGVPVFTKPTAPRGLIGQQEKRAVMRLFDEAIASGNAIGYNGPEEDGYCREFAALLGDGYADGVNSGTSAVYVALRALEIPPGSEVIVPPITDPGGAMPVPLLNCIPVPADAAPGSYNAGADQIAARLTRRTRAIIVAHIAGEPVAMGPVLQLAGARGLPVIEDCAQSHGATLGGKPCGTFGTVAAFSTMFGKHHCTGGQGGVVYTKSKGLYWKIRQCADRGKPFGLKKAGGNVLASLNFNMDEIAAAIGRVQLRKLPKIVARRRAVAERIRQAVAGLRAVYAPPFVRGAHPSYWFLRLGLRADRLTVSKLRFCEALQAEIHLPVSSSYRAVAVEQPWAVERRVFGAPGLPWTLPQYRGDPDKKYPLPNVDAATAAGFSIMIHEGLTVADATRIIKALAKVETAYLQPECAG